LAWGAGLVALVLFTYSPGDAEQQRLRTRVIGLAFLAGVGFGAYFILQARAGGDTGLWPLLLSRVVALGLVVLLVTRRRTRRGPAPSMGRQVALVALAAGGRVIVALHPAVTVVLAVGVLGERAGRIARYGLALSAVSLALIAQ
jgi:drug/metabolite transporter (DMT)-like permease